MTVQMHLHYAVSPLSPDSRRLPPAIENKSKGRVVLHKHYAVSRSALSEFRKMMFLLKNVQIDAALRQDHVTLPSDSRGSLKLD